MGRLTKIVAWLPLIGILLIGLGCMPEILGDALSYVAKILGFAIIFMAILYVVIFILIPLFILAIGLVYRKQLRGIAKKAWEESKYMLIALGVQSVVAYLSILIQSFVKLGFWPLIGLFFLNSILLLNLAGECYAYTAVSDSDAGIAVFVLGSMMYGVYVYNLLSTLGLAL